jgi:hypothetical protein
VVEHLLDRQFAVAARPEDHACDAHAPLLQQGAGSEHHGVAQGAGKAGLLAACEHVAPDVDE